MTGLKLTLIYDLSNIGYFSRKEYILKNAHRSTQKIYVLSPYQGYDVILMGIKDFNTATLSAS